MSEELKDLYESGKFQEVLDQYTRKINQRESAEISEDEQMECVYYKARSLALLGRHEEALQTAIIAYQTYTSPQNRGSILALLAAKFWALAMASKAGSEEARTIIEEGEAIMREFTDRDRQNGMVWVGIFNYMKASGYYGRNEFESAIKYWGQALKIFEALDNRFGIAECLGALGDSFHKKGEQEIALEHLQRSLPIWEAIDNKHKIGWTLSGIGQVYSAKREFDTALEYFQKQLKIIKPSDDPIYYYFALTHSGSVYSAKGDYDKALDCFRQSLAIVEPLDIDWAISYNFCHIGRTYHQKGALDVALPFYQSSLKSWETMKSDYEVVRVLFYLILLSLEQMKVDQAQKHLIALQETTARIPADATFAHLRNRLAEALILKESPRMLEKARAQALLRQIVKEKRHEFYSIAVLALCDLLLYELKAAGEPEVWKEAKTLIHQFYTEVHDKQEFNMVVNALLLRARFATIDGKLEQALKNYNESRMIVKEKNLNQLMQKLEIEQNELETDFHKWQDLIQQHTSLQERLIHAQLTEYLQEAQRIVQRSSLKDD